MQHYYNLQIFDLLTPPQGPRVCVCMCLHGALCSISFNLKCNMTLFSKKKKLTFWPHPRGSVCVCKDRICACMVLYAPFPLIEYATLLLSGKKNDLTLSRGWRVCVLWQNMYLRVAAFVILFKMICTMTMFWKSWILTFWPPRIGGWDLRVKYLLHAPFP